MADKSEGVIFFLKSYNLLKNTRLVNHSSKIF